jgi:predicted RNase H-like HicB family nuclease
MKIVVIIMELSPDVHKAHCPALPGCMVLAGSRQEAAERISRAVRGYLASFDATVPEKLELEIREHGRDVRGPVRESSSGALATRSAAW